MIGTTLLSLGWGPGVRAQRPFAPRRPSVEPKPAHQLRNVATWPAEPAAPAEIDEAKFHLAFARLCAVDPDGAVADLAGPTLAAARAEGVDPFELAALAFVTTGCDARHDKRASAGLLAIDVEMYRAPGAPALAPELRALLTKRRLRDPAASLAAGAKLLAMWQGTHAASDQAFGGVPHRDAVSHFFWGDEVKSSGHEDLVLTARRRMLVAYAGAPSAARPTRVGVPLVSPIEAPPRVATSGPGDDRDGGARQHRGLDLVASIGEPVRAVASGTVIFAGVNLPGHPRKDDIPPAKLARYARRRLGVGGIYVCIDHDAAEHKVVTCYMHLKSYVISQRDHVDAGQTIGFVGTTGVKVSPPHLHFEVRVDDMFTNPLRVLGDWAIPPKATMTHYYMLKAKRARLHASAALGRSRGA
ncbi:MAG TPA: M23 family metallopeptidase [Polyangia bacterium]|nr:M23 family metallopeptidase [Polyangia bacterium]